MFYTVGYKTRQVFAEMSDRRTHAADVSLHNRITQSEPFYVAEMRKVRSSVINREHILKFMTKQNISSSKLVNSVFDFRLR